MKVFRVLEVSMNRDSFGLRGVILVAKDGEAWEIGVGEGHFPQRGQDYACPEPETYKRAGQSYFPEWASCYGWEIPRRLPTAPPAVVKHAFADCNLEAR